VRRLNIHHVTEYRFPEPASLLPHRLLLRPRENHNVRIECAELDIVPAHSVQWKRDVLDNSVAVVSFSEPTDHLCIASNVIIAHYEDNPFDFLLEDYAVAYPFAYADAEQAELAAFQQADYPADGEAVRQWLAAMDLGRPDQTIVLLDRLNRAIANGFAYQIREEPGVQGPALTLALNAGSCRDFAALFIEACRGLGLASRFVSGYLYVEAGEADSASTHAWAEVYLPGAGWKGFDPTSGTVTGDRHIAVAVARHPEAVLPVVGSYLGPPTNEPELSISARVIELDGKG